MPLRTLPPPVVQHLQSLVRKQLLNRGQVFVLGSHAEEAQELGRALKLEGPSSSLQMVSASQLAHLIHWGRRSQIPLFQKPTTILTVDQDTEFLFPTHWETIIEAAKQSPCPISFHNAGDPVVVSLASRRKNFK